jgi:uncharacterized membrane protein YciS (DUF1049 family)
MERMRLARRLLGLALFVGALVVGWRFAGRNSAVVSVDYLLGQTAEVSLWAALLGAFGLGAFGVGAIGVYQLARLQLMARRYRKKVRGLESEIHQLRNLPLADEAAPRRESLAGIDAPTGSALERGA